MGVYLRGRFYWYKRTIDGVAYYRSLTIKKGQESMLSERITQIDDQITAEHCGLPVPISAGSISLSEFIEIYKKRKAGKGSLDRDIQRLNFAAELMGDKRIRAYGKDDFQKLEEKLFAKKRAPSTVNRYFQVLHHLFDIAIKERAIAKNPLADFEYFIEDESRGHALSNEEIKALLDNLRRIRDNAKVNEHVKAVLYDLVLFGLYTGARLSEIIFLRHDHIKGDVVRLKISETKFRKRGKRSSIKEKLIYLSPEALAIVGRQKKNRDGFVFPLQRRDSRVISKAIHTMRKDLGVKDFSFHSLRHTFISRAASLGDTATIRSLVGHSDYRTTLRYTHPEESKKRKITTKIGTRIRSLVVND